MNYVISLLKEIVRKRKLIWDLGKADFRKRFVGSYFGIVWMFIQPVVTVVIYAVIFGIGFKSPPPVPGAAVRHDSDSDGIGILVRLFRGV